MATVTRVTFASEGIDLVGDLYLPAEAAQGVPLPGLVATGSWTTVKEQMAGRYARRLAEWGFVTLAFDFRGYGDSAGLPRDVESPSAKTADINAAVGFLAGHDTVDADRIGALGVCASAGYTAVNTADDRRVRSLALVAPWLHNAELVRTLYGGDEGVAQRVTAGQDARARFEASGEVDYVPAISGTDERAAMYGDFSGPGDYYLNPGRGGIPQWSNRFAVMAWPEWLGYDPIGSAPRIAQPVLMVHSRDAAVPDGARAFHDGLAGPKELVWTEGTQLDFYDQQPQVTLAVRTVTEHFRATL
jgi:fermentation-respiration switch protein FrsA (DUF1100 family)